MNTTFPRVNTSVAALTTLLSANSTPNVTDATVYNQLVNGSITTNNPVENGSATAKYDQLVNGTGATVVMLVILMVIGVIGNIHVLAVFGLNFQKSSTYVTFVFSLAVINFLMCSIEIPFEILDLLYPYGLFSGSFCKVFRSSNAGLSMSSVFLLLLIAVDRYKRVCHPLKIQWSIKKSRILIVTVISVATFLAIPVIFVFGPHTTEIAAGVHVQKCFFDDNVKGSLYPLMYLVVLQLVAVVSELVLVFSYLSIGLAIRKHARKRAKMTQFQIKRSKIKKVCSENLNSLSNHSSLSDMDSVKTLSISIIDIKEKMEMSGDDPKEHDNEISKYDKQKSKTTQTPEADNDFSDVHDDEDNNRNSCSTTQSEVKNNIKKKRASINSQAKKHTKVFFVVTLVFIIMYTPYLILGVFLALKDKFRENMNDVELTFYRLAMRLVYVNDVINCFIYGVFDHRFKTCVFRFYKRLFSLFKRN
ncbi:dopamine receptor 2-like [Saccostrea echinata]|uniref:dopamine receptor 2-like n=1 Tax=Saccostrea echinata TaxID=191078 RepID=UPI002A7FDD87|nr:dopamine receptor 2-like [Saccostrea echinata]